jgi:DNA anti-recombination protein RmuC
MIPTREQQREERITAVSNALRALVKQLQKMCEKRGVAAEKALDRAVSGVAEAIDAQYRERDKAMEELEKLASQFSSMSSSQAAKYMETAEKYGKLQCALEDAVERILRKICSK